MNEHDLERTIIEHANGFTIVSTRIVEPSTEPSVLSSQCEHVFYSQVPIKVAWLFIVRYDPRGWPIKHNVAEEYDIKEEYDVEEQVVV